MLQNTCIVYKMAGLAVRQVIGLLGVNMLSNCVSYVVFPKWGSKT